MALNWKVYKDKEYRAAFRWVDDAVVLVSVLGEGAAIKFGFRFHRLLTVWREGQEVVSASESYDRAAETCLKRVNDYVNSGELKKREAGIR